MVTPTLVIILALVGIISLAAGIISLIKYARTKSKLFLVLGIMLTFVVPGIILFVVFRIWPIDTGVVYGPGPGVLYGPQFPK